MKPMIFFSILTSLVLNLNPYKRLFFSLSFNRFYYSTSILGYRWCFYLITLIRQQRIWYCQISVFAIFIWHGLKIKKRIRVCKVRGCVRFVPESSIRRHITISEIGLSHKCQTQATLSYCWGTFIVSYPKWIAARERASNVSSRSEDQSATDSVQRSRLKLHSRGRTAPCEGRSSCGNRDHLTSR